MLPRQERLRRHGEFKGVYERGRSYAHRALVLFVLTEQRGVRVGFSVPGRLGGAVVRNKVRRRLRAAYRAVRPEIPEGWHLVVLARAASRDLGVDELTRVLRELVQRARGLEASEHEGGGQSRSHGG